MPLPSIRLTNLFGFALAAYGLSLALYSEHFLGYEPCPMCILQRIAIIAVGIAFLLALIHNPKGRGSKVYATTTLLGAILYASIAARHLWIQSLPAEEVPVCSFGVDFMLETFPLWEVFSMILTGSAACAEREEIFGLRIPVWSMIVSFAFAIMSLSILFRRKD